MTLPPLTYEQQAVLDSTARLVVVRACPGSGKTRVFVDSLKKRLENRPHGTGGIAALSFTNVAQEEVAKRLGGHPPEPHFIGTLDTFMLRFVVRPFAHLIGVTGDGVELVPSPLDSYLKKPDVWPTDNGKDAISIFEAHALAGTETAPQFYFYNTTLRKTVPVPANVMQQMFEKKKKQWATRGRITHSDCQYLAASILMHPQHGPTVLNLLSKRFPVILVDEFQDTGWFLGRALLQLLGHPDVSGLVVGDPDQAIYEFTGADPGLFAKAEQLVGAEVLRLQETRRCPKRIAAIATALSASNAEVKPKDEADDGKAVVLVHDLADPHLEPAIEEKILGLHIPGETAVVLSRKRPTVEKLSGKSQNAPEKIGRVILRLDRAAAALLQGDSAAAARDVASMLSGLMWKEYVPTSALLREKTIRPRDWRRAVYGILLTAARAGEAEETWEKWILRCKEAVRCAAEDLGHPIEGKLLGSNFKKFARSEDIRGGPSTSEHPVGTQQLDLRRHVRTVHQAKGAEFHTVVLFVPKPHAQHAKCPSAEWWPNGGNQEERRIAFVAASRSQHSFVLCLHRDSFQNFTRTRASFMKLFDEVLDVTHNGIFKNLEPS